MKKNRHSIAIAVAIITLVYIHSCTTALLPVMSTEGSGRIRCITFCACAVIAMDQYYQKTAVVNDKGSTYQPLTIAFRGIHPKFCLQVLNW